MVYETKIKNFKSLVNICLLLVFGTVRLSYADIASTDSFTILSANDLGMHCADQDYRIFSILPPYNVLNAQVLKKGVEPEMMTPTDVYVTYKAVESNYFSDFNDPARLPVATDSFTSTGLNLPSIFKNNFWETVSGKSLITIVLGNSFYHIPVPSSVSDTGIDKLG